MARRRKTARSLTALTLAGALVLPGPAVFAAPEPVSKEVAAKKPDGKRAAEAAMRAMKLQREGKQKEAAELFLEAFEAAGRPPHLRSAAKAYEDAGLDDEALPAWTRYRDLAGLTEEERADGAAHVQIIEAKKRAAEEARAKAKRDEEAREAELKQREDARRTAEEAERARLAAEAAARERTTRAPWILAGSGAAALAAGGVVWLLASSRTGALDDAIARTDATGHIIGTTPADVSSEVSGINRLRITSGVLASVGAVALGAGLTWLLLGEPAGPKRSASEAAPAAALTPVVSSDGVGFGLSGVF